MPYIIERVDDKKCGLTGVLLNTQELNNWQRKSKKRESLTVRNTTTMRRHKIKGLLP